MGNVKVLIQKWLAVITMLVIILGQYAITGYLATSYAIDLLATQSNNVQFRAYFKNGEEELTEIESSIDSNNLKLKIDVAVKTEGYFNGKISFQNAGFKLTEAVTNNYIREVRDNIIYLNQINSEETASIEIGIEYFKDNQIQASTLNQITTVKLNGEYTYSGGKVTINGGSDVKVIWKIPENVKAELAAKLQTNSTYQVNEENKKIVQFLTSSKLTNNAFPVKSTQITATIPTGATNVEVHKRTTKATNGDKDFTTENYNVENNILTITINNEETDGKISWEKGVNDIFVVTYEYPENTDLSIQTIVINEKITAQNNIELNADPVQLLLIDEKDGIASITKQEGENSIYKGKIYSQEGRDISSYSIVYMEYVNGVKDIEITEETPKFVKEIEENGEITKQENEANVDIKSIKINKQSVASVLGNTWTLTIGDKTITNETITNVNEGIDVSENGDIIVTLNDGINNLKITTSKPVSNGLFIIETTKRITGTNYTRAQLKEFTKLKDGASIKYTKNNDDTFTYTSWNNINLKDTESKASLQSEQTALIAGTDTQQLNLTVVLESNGEKQDLYKNPEIKIKLPSQVKNVTYTQIPQLMYANGLELTEGNYKVIEENGQRVLDINLTGEQTSYLGEALQGSTLFITTNVQIDQAATDSNEEIVMTYTNENATKYTDNGTEKVNIQISAMQQQEENTGTEGNENQQGGETGNQEQNGSQGQSGDESGSQGQSGDESGSSGSGTQDDNNGTREESGSQAGNTQNQKQGTIGQLKYSVSARVGGETIQEGDTVRAGEIIEYTIRLENPTTENIEGVSISATVPENTTLMVEDPNYPEYNQEDGTHSTDGSPLVESNNTQVTKENITIKGNGTKEFSYLLKIDSSLTDTKEIEARVTINSNNTNQIVKFLNTIAKANLIATIKPLNRNSNDPLSFGYTYMYEMNIKNNTNEELRNIQVSLNQNEFFNIKKIEYYTVDNTITIKDKVFTIDSLRAKDVLSVTIYAGIRENANASNTAQMFFTIKDSKDNKYRTNLIVDKIGGVLATISLESKDLLNRSSKLLKEGDEILYKIIVKNTGNKRADNLLVEDKFSEYLELEEVTLNNTKCEYLLYKDNEENNVRYNKIVINKELAVDEEITINIKGKLKENLTNNTIEIFNQADVFNEILLAETEKDIYYLQVSNKSQTGNNTGEISNGDIVKNDTDINGNEDKQINMISGTAWLDEDENGQKNSNEKLLEGIKVILFDIENSKEITNTTTDYKGSYYFKNISNGKYVIIFEYDTKKYVLTKYQAEDSRLDTNSDVENVVMNLNGKDKKVACTDTLSINSNRIANIDIGLVEAKKFDLSLSKTISQISISNATGHKTIDFSDTNLAKVEIKSKYLKGSVVMIKYKIKVTNNGELAGYVKKIVDNKPSDLKFNSKLNPDWYQSDNCLYTTSLSDIQIEPGESKEVSLILIKTMTESNTGLSNNKAKISDYYNSLGIVDENSIYDDDISQADLIVSVSTGIATKFTVIVLFLIIAISTFVYQVCKRILRNNIYFL